MQLLASKPLRNLCVILSHADPRRRSNGVIDYQALHIPDTPHCTRRLLKNSTCMSCSVPFSGHGHIHAQQSIFAFVARHTRTTRLSYNAKKSFPCPWFLLILPRIFGSVSQFSLHKTAKFSPACCMTAWSIQTKIARCA